MTEFTVVIHLHYLTILPCFFLGTLLLIIKKRSLFHKIIGRVYLTLSLLTAMFTLFLSAAAGPEIHRVFCWVHLYSILIIYAVPAALIAIKNGDVKKHRKKMHILYFGSITIAGGFMLIPGRFLNIIIFG